MDNSTFSDNSRCSSFEALNQHDPNLSKLAKNMFQKTNDYLNFEVNRIFSYFWDFKKFLIHGVALIKLARLPVDRGHESGSFEKRGKLEKGNRRSCGNERRTLQQIQ